jgi:limonene-1,2-epoxide hydrolase
MPQPSAAQQRVLDFMDCWRRADLEGAAARLADDVVFVPDPRAGPITGRDAVRAEFGRYMDMMQSYEFDTRQLVSSDTVVFLERLEHFGSKRGVVVTLPITGVYELDREGRITAWRDYWDPAMAAAMGAPG